MRADLGAVLKAVRQGRFGTVGPIKQEVLAADVGITRAALSRIENGLAWPRPGTLDRLMDELELDWPQVAHRGPGMRPSRRFNGTPQGQQMADLCARLRTRRQALGWSLARLARRSGVSAAQLSRIERVQCRWSGVFAWHGDDLRFLRDDRRIVFGNAVLRDVAAGRTAQEMEESGPDTPS